MYISKILHIMRLTTVILLATMLQVSASSFGQKVTFKQKGTTLLKVFKAIEIQTGFSVIYYDKKVNTGSIIDANFNNAPLEEVMNHILSGMPLTYTINKTNVVIKEKEHSLVDKIIDIFTNIDVRGKVVDENGQGLAGATIKVKGSTKSVLSNSEGEFFIANVDDKAVLVISYLGYESKEVGAAEKLGTIGLSMSNGKLEEVEINAGYYKVSDRERTGNISKVTAETIGKQPVNNPLMALQGRVAGLQVTQQTGLPGSGFTVQIRGINSIKSGNEPLYIIDGVNYPSTRISGTTTSTALGINGVSPLSMINPGDIESIEILKDADATAIYGSRGANGVILITTKKGTIGNTKINANMSQGFSKIGHFVDMLNTQEYIAMRREALVNDGLQFTTADYDLNGTWDQNHYIDWQKELYGGTAKITNASLDISGGTHKSNYLIAGNYYREGTVYPGNFGFKRYGFHSNITLGSDQDRFSANLNTNFSHTQSDLISSNLSSYITLAPNQPAPYDQYGNLNWANNTVIINPMAYLLQTSDASTDNLIGNLILNYKILNNLILKSSIGYSRIGRQEFLKFPLAAIDPSSSSYTSSSRTSSFGNNYNNNFQLEPMIMYSNDTRMGNFDALIGLSLQDNKSQLNVVRGSNYTSDDLMENIGSAGTITSQQSQFSQYRYLAIFARLNYNLNSKYFLNLTARRDGSSRFGPGNKFANFGAIGAAWIFNNENFFKENLTFLSFGKLRASYGITGNDQIANYSYLQLWNNNGTYQGGPTITPSNTGPNYDFAWETNRKLEAALQLGFLKERLNLEISFYRNRSSNQLLARTLPLSTGLGSLIFNLPATVQNRGWEFDTTLKILDNKYWQWTTSINLTIPQNKLLSYPGLENSNDAINYKIGEPLSILKAYSITIDKQTGLYDIEDKNGNGTIDNGDRYLTKFIGQYYYGGLQNSISYKQFSLDFHFSFTKQNAQDYRVATPVAPGATLLSTASNQTTEVLKRWQKPGDDSNIQKFSTTSVNNTLYGSAKNYGNIFIVDASFIRLRNISFGYSLPKNMLSKLKLSNAIISLQGQNIFTLTNYVGIDAETSGFNYPPLQTLTLGLNLTF